MYDCRIRALCVGKLPTEVLSIVRDKTHKEWVESHPSQEKAPPMAVHSTSCSICLWLFTIYDLRFEKFPRLRASSAEQMRAKCDEAVHGHS